MNEDLLYPSSPTYDETTSKIALLDIFKRQDWIKYSSTQNIRFEYWLKRYLNLHAKIPSIFHPTPEPLLVPAIAPLATFRIVANSGNIYDGGGFSNGAVLRIRARQLNVKILMVDKEIIELFDYDMTPINPIDASVFLNNKRSSDDGRAETS